MPLAPNVVRSHTACINGFACACACGCCVDSEGFFPHFAKVEAWRRARPRIAVFRGALLAHTGLTASENTPAADRPIVFSLRRKYRCISNEAEVVAAVRATPSLARVVTFVNFADVSLREQLRMVLQASAIAGVHGQGLVGESRAHTVHALPTAHCVCAPS